MLALVPHQGGAELGESCSTFVSPLEPLAFTGQLVQGAGNGGKNSDGSSVV